MKFLSFINLTWGLVRSHTKFGLDGFRRFDVYWTQTNRQAKFLYRLDKQIDRETTTFPSLGSTSTNSHSTYFPLSPISLLSSLTHKNSACFEKVSSIIKTKSTLKCCNALTYLCFSVALYTYILALKSTCC